MARRVRHPAIERGHHVGRHRNPLFAIDYLEKHGGAADRPLLREYACKSGFGDSAIDALKAIEERMVSSGRSGKPTTWRSLARALRHDRSAK